VEPIATPALCGVVPVDGRRIGPYEAAERALVEGHAVARFDQRVLDEVTSDPYLDAVLYAPSRDSRIQRVYGQAFRHASWSDPNDV